MTPRLVFVIVILVGIISCAFGKTSVTWVSGSNLTNQNSIYGTKGIAAPDNIPGARNSGASWIDAQGNLWLFGGWGYNDSGFAQYLNDLWKFDGNDWTWVSGSNGLNERGAYGTKGVASSDNFPGARSSSVSWTDSQGNLWLFGGNGCAVQRFGALNDLWKFDGTNWTWVGGSNVEDQYGVYGTKGVPASDNIPGARYNSVVSVDARGNVWLFGGQGYDRSYNDLWKFDGNNWTWISGSNGGRLEIGVYGTKGVPASGNVPGERGGGVSWIDTKGNFWLFGGEGRDASYGFGSLNDLWKFDGTNWTWVSGSNIVNQNGIYGARGCAASGNTPGARCSNISWIDAQDNLWLFGGGGFDVNGNGGNLNDLWKFDGENWMWVCGSSTAEQNGVYGTRGVAASGNFPGSRNTSFFWIDARGCFWLYGGYGYTEASEPGFLNDLWKLDISLLTITKCKVTAGKIRGRDTFSASGTVKFLSPFDLNDVNHIDVNIILLTDNAPVYTQIVNADIVNGKFQYKNKISSRGTGTITSLLVDSKKNTFSIIARNIDLAGLGCPLRLILTIGGDELPGAADESIVNGQKKLIPTLLMMAYSDTLIVNKAVARHNSKKAFSDKLSVKGDIAVIDPNVNLSACDVNFIWGTQSFSVPPGSFHPAGTRHLYKCRKVVADANGDSAIVTARIDLDKAAFTLSITNANGLDASSSSMPLGVCFADFNEIADVNLAAGRSW